MEPSDKTDPTATTDTPDATDPTNPAEPVKTPEPSNANDPTGKTNPSDTTVPAGATGPTDTTTPAETTGPADTTDPTGTAVPVEASAEATEPTDTTDPSSEETSNREALQELEQADIALFRAVAGWNTPFLDRTMPALSNVASNSVLWIGTAAVLAAVGGRRGRLVAAEALVAVGITSAVTNLAAKNLVRRPRPDSEVPDSRRLEQPESSSFPSGHSASAAAFSAVVGSEYRLLYLPINALAAAVGFSRVYTGVHYPGDVAAGWTVGRVVGGTVRTVWPNKWR